MTTKEERQQKMIILVEELDQQVNSMARGLMVVEPDDLNEVEELLILGDLSRVVKYIKNVNEDLLEIITRNKVEGKDLNKRFHERQMSIQFKDNILFPQTIVHR